jgi:uncharacterized protein
MSTSANNVGGKCIFITGVSGGIGGAVAQLFLSEGWEVWGTARASTGWARFANEDAFHGVILDLHDSATTQDAFAAAWRDAGGFDVVVNNAGYGVFGPFGEVSPSELDLQLQAMVDNTARLIRQQWVEFARQGRGTLVNVSSLAVEFPLPFMSGYNMAKAALSALSESLMMEAAGTELVVIDFRPGDINTGFNQAMTANACEAIAATPHENVASAWNVLEQNIQHAPGADSAARSLRRAVQRGRSGSVRCGAVFQARLAPVLTRLIPERCARWIRWRYFGIK